MKHLDELERRLEQAASEVRQAARQSTPPPIETRPARAGVGWLAFAAAFVIVVLAVGVLPMLTRSGDPDTVATTATTSPAVATTALPAPASTVPGSTTAPQGNCSAAGMNPPPDQTGLPAAVAELRRAIITAAIACDYETLESLAGPELTTSFGGGGPENLRRWEEEGEGRLATLVLLFGTRFAVQEFEDLPRYFVWPAAFAYDTWDEIPEADLEELRTIYSDEELEEIAGFGSYAGWRVGITEHGDWQFFVAGD